MSEQYAMTTTPLPDGASVSETTSTTEEEHHSSCRVEAFALLSAVYAQVLTSMCVAYLVAEVLTHNIPVYHFEGFFTYLYIVSILFLMYILCYLNREHPRNLCGLCQLPKFSFNICRCCCCCKRLKWKNVKKDKVTSNEESHGNFFLRFGIVIFGVGTVIRSIFELVEYSQVDPDSPCYYVTYGLNAGLHLCFTLLQIYFLVLNPRMNIQKFKYIAQFGVMHLVATNLCVWFKILVRESLMDVQEYEELYHEKLQTVIDAGDPKKVEEFSKHHEHATTLDILNCSIKEPQVDLVRASSAYLFPFVIEYSLIAFTFTYNMWRHIGANPRDEHKVVPPKQSECDWSHTCAGFFIGLIVFGGTLFSLIVFFTQINSGYEDWVKLGVGFLDGYHCITLLVSIVACMYGLDEAQSMPFSDKKGDSLSNFLLKSTAFGWYIYSLFTVTACVLTEGVPHGDRNQYIYDEIPVNEVAIVMVVAIVTMIQITIQLFFIDDLKRRCLSERSRGNRPARQTVTFLFMCNASLWVLYTFEMAKVQANPVQRYFYGAVPWAVLLRITLPMGIFFRFHSTVSLAEIWKDSYKKHS